jgi:FkbM family methyltransferase
MKKRIKRDNVSFYISKKSDSLYGVNWWDNYTTYETRLFKILRKNKKYNTLIDIGAGIGAISLYAEKFFKKTFCFDPNPIAYNIFKRNLGLNKNKNIKLFNAAITRQDGFQQFKTGKIFSKINFHKIDKVYKIKCINLNNFIKKNKLENNNIFIKIDIEGGEFNLISDENFLKLFDNKNYCLYLAVHFGFMTDLKFKNRFLRHLVSMPDLLKEYYHLYKLVKKFKFIEINGKRQNNKLFFFRRFFRRNPDLYLYN